MELYHVELEAHYIAMLSKPNSNIYTLSVYKLIIVEFLSTPSRIDPAVSVLQIAGHSIMHGGLTIPALLWENGA
ncbi:hypothetical protein DPMN_189721 [Dreissena polymorpha]|uniref:Uncharacterized protein n=1 Tax=Dreissena polymorpha TaxID=45954 RepID=A0A9D4DUU7_DREPO|nr:hypothetical protein DPMN_189721 [Dreissena polymorpha]